MSMLVAVDALVSELNDRWLPSLHTDKLEAGRGAAREAASMVLSVRGSSEACRRAALGVAVVSLSFSSRSRTRPARCTRGVVGALALAGLCIGGRGGRSSSAMADAERTSGDAGGGDMTLGVAVAAAVGVRVAGAGMSGSVIDWSIIHDWRGAGGADGSIS
jgi:hypothetical protein